MTSSLQPWPDRASTPDLDLALAAVEAHREGLERGEGVLKREHKTAITRVRVGDQELVVKQYRDMGPRFWLKGMFRPHPGRRSHRAAVEMEHRGIPTSTLVGLLERQRLGLAVESWLVTRAVPGALEMDVYMDREFRGGGDRVRRRRFVRAFAAQLVALIESGIHHGDLKTCNILVRESEEGWTFHFIDLDDVEIRPAGTLPSRPEWVLLLGQLNPSTLKDVPRTDRLLFLGEIPQLGAFDRRRLVADVEELSRRRRRCHFIVDGVVDEDYP